MNDRSTPTTQNPSAPGPQGWTRLCDSGRLIPERAVAVLAPDGAQVAIVRTADGRLFAVGHHDPYALANVIACGGVGTRTVDDRGATSSSRRSTSRPSTW